MAVTIKKGAPKLAPIEDQTPIKFQCMKAASEIPKEEELTFPLCASFKLDGIRSPMICGKAMSLKMLPLPNRFIQEWAEENKDYLHGFDGELIVGPPNLPTTFNTTSSGVMKASGEPDFKFYVFEHWNMGECSAVDRHQFLTEFNLLMSPALRSRVVILRQRLIFNIAELRAYYAEAIALGYEGLILKSPYAAYKFGRSTIKGGQALKWKEFIDYTCVVLEVKQGKTNTNEKVRDELGHAKRSTAKAGKVLTNEVGGFVVKCIEPESVYFGMKFNCGPGSLTQDELKRLWKIRDQLVSKPVRVKSQKSGGKTLPRFPSWYGWLHNMNIGGV